MPRARNPNPVLVKAECAEKETTGMWIWVQTHWRHPQKIHLEGRQEEPAFFHLHPRGRRSRKGSPRLPSPNALRKLACTQQGHNHESHEYNTQLDNAATSLK